MQSIMVIFIAYSHRLHSRSQLPMRKSLFLLFSIFSICFLQNIACLNAQSTSATDSQAIIQQLKAENDALKLELQTLRKLLANSPTHAIGQSAPQVNSNNIASTSAGATQSSSYWITLSSKKRHNSSCRYYQNSNGRLCSPEEGIPCKICGG
jgi:hypothetical protein